MQASVQDLSLDWTGVDLCEDSTVAKKPTIVPQPIPLHVVHAKQKLILVQM